MISEFSRNKQIAIDHLMWSLNLKKKGNICKIKIYLNYYDTKIFIIKYI